MTNRDKLVELINHVCEHHIENLLQPGGAEALADHLIANGVMVRDMVPITEEIPDGDCLAVNNRGAYTVGKIVKDPYLSTVTGYSCMRDGIGIANVTHWMSLPKIKKEETSNE